MFYRSIGLSSSFAVCTLITFTFIMFRIEGDLFQSFSVYICNTANLCLSVSWFTYFLYNKENSCCLRLNFCLHLISWMASLFYIVYGFGFSNGILFTNPLDVMCELSLLCHPVFFVLYYLVSKAHSDETGYRLSVDHISV